MSEVPHLIAGKELLLRQSGSEFGINVRVKLIVKQKDY